mgnify:CR=1 FL=1
MSIEEMLTNATESNALFKELSKEERQYNAIMAHISARISKARYDMKMSQKEFADFMGVTQGMVSRWECSACNFTFQKAISIFTKLNIPFDISFNDKKEKRKCSPVPLSLYGCKSEMDGWQDIRGKLDTNQSISKAG